MRDQEIVGLWESYHQIYESKQNNNSYPETENHFDEEVELATQYFYEMGLNEDGVEILIEELGVSQFTDFVYDIAEESLLVEARSGGSRIEPVTAKGQKFKSGKPTGKSLERLRAQKSARRDAEEKASAAKPSGLKASLQRQSAITNAKSKQKPSSSSSTQTKKGIGGLIGSIVQRAKQDTELLKKSVNTAKNVAARRGAEAKAVFDVARERGKKAEQSPQATRARRKATVAVGRAAQAAGKTAVKAAGAAGAAAGEGVKAHRQGKTGAQIAGRAAGTFVRKMTKEDYECVEEMVNDLLEEGYDLSEYTWDDIYDIYETTTLNEKKLSTKSGMSPENRKTRDELVRKYGPEFLSNPRRQSQSNTRSASKVLPQTTEPPRKRTTKLSDVQIRENTFDIILEYLISEGYANTEEAALTIMINMSEEWRESIVEAKVDKKLPEWKRSAARTERYGNPHGSVGSGPQRDRRSEHEERRGKKKD